MSRINFCTRIFLNFIPTTSKLNGSVYVPIAENRWINQDVVGWSFISRDESDDESRNREHFSTLLVPPALTHLSSRDSNCYANASMIIRRSPSGAPLSTFFVGQSQRTET